MAAILHLTALTVPPPGAAAWLTFAQAGSNASQRAQEVFWAVGGIVLAAVAIVVVALIVRRVYARPDEPGPTGGFTLADMRRMHAAGELSDEEFEAARAALIARGLAATGGDKGKGAAEPEPRHLGDVDTNQPDNPETDDPERSA